MKKILSVFVVIAILFTLSTTAFAAYYDTEKNDTQFFSTIGIFPADAKEDATVTRIELAEIFYNIVFPNKSVSAGPDGEVNFTDVPPEKKHVVATAAALGAMRGYSAEIFAPDDVVTYAQTVKAIVSFMGYDLQANQLGGYPSGYLAQASRLQILSSANISGDSKATYGGVAAILKKAIGKDIAVWNHATSDGTATQDVLEGTDYLEYYRKISLMKGKITGNYLTNIKGGDTTNYFGVYVNGEKMNIAETAHGIQDLIGYEVYIYYTETENGKTAIYYETGTNNVLEIMSGNIAGIAGNEIKYYVDGQDNVYTATFTANATLIYNGTYETSYTAADLNPFATKNLDGSLKLIDSDGDSTFETIVVTAYETIVVRDVLDNKIYGEYDMSGNTTVIDISNYKERNINIRNLDGEAVDPKDIKKGVVLNVCYDKNGAIKEIIGSKDSTTGVIEEISYEGSKISAIKINGLEFKASAGLVVIDSANKLKPGASATVFFNSNANAAFIDLEGHYTDGYSTGYLVDAGVEGQIEKKVLCMVFSAEGEMKTLTLAERVILDDKFEQALTVLEKFGKEKERVKRQLILYKTDSEGKTITTIQIPTKLESDAEAFNGLYEYPGEGYYYTGAHRSFNDQYLVNSDTVCFAVPGEADRDRYEHYSITKLSTSSSYTLGSPTALNKNIRLYGQDENALIVSYAVMFSAGGSSEGLDKRPLFVVSKVVNAQDPNGEEKLKVSGVYFQETTVLEGSFYIDPQLLISGHESIYPTNKVPTGTRPFINQSETMIEPGDIFKTPFFDGNGIIDTMNCNQFYQLYDIGDDVFAEVEGVGFALDRSSSGTYHYFGHVLYNSGTSAKVILGNNINVATPKYKAYEFSSGQYKFIEVTKHPVTGKVNVEIVKSNVIRSQKAFPGKASRVLTLLRDFGIGCVVLNFN